MENSLLQRTTEWQIDLGHKLALEGFIHIFRFKVDEQYPGIATAPALSMEEKEKASRFLKEQDRQSYITSKHFLRLVLSRFLKILPKDIVYQYSGNKKPCLPGLHFNLSHAKNQVIIAVGEYPLGVDVEYIDPHFTFTEIADMCFNTSEVAFLSSGANPLINFYTLWTRKEALLKATGEGLVNQLNQVPALPLQTTRNDQSFSVQSFKSDNAYLVSLASKATAQLSLRYWKQKEV